MTTRMDFLKRGAVRALRSAERYTKTDMVYIAENGFWLGLKTILGALIALGVSVAFANLLPVHTYGEYKYVISVLAIIALSTLPGFGTSVVRAVAKGFDGTPLAVLKTKILWGLMGGALSACLALYYYTQGNLGLAGAFGAAALFIPFVDTLGIFSTVLTGKKLFRVSIVYETAVQLVAALSIGVVLWYTDSLAYVILAYFASYTLVRGAVLWIVLARYTQNSHVEAGSITYGFHLSAMEVLGTIAESINNLLLWFFIGPAPLAIYAFARAMPVQIIGGLKKLTLIALPKFAERDFGRIKETLLRRLMWLWLGLFVIFLAYIFAAPYIFETLFPKYTEAIFYSQLLALSILFFPKKVIGTVFNAHAKTGALYAHSVLTPLVLLALGIALVPTYGILGAVVAELTSQAFALGLLATILIRSN